MRMTETQVTMRVATVDDAAMIAEHRNRMFADNGFATAERLGEMEAVFAEWVRARIADGRYVGMLLEEGGVCVAAAGIFFAEFPPHYLDLEPVRPYLLNFYTAPEWRGKGLAKRLVKACVELCRERGCKVVTLHASKFGRPVYEGFGFKQSNELMLRLVEDEAAQL